MRVRFLFFLSFALVLGACTASSALQPGSRAELVSPDGRISVRMAPGGGFGISFKKL